MEIILNSCSGTCRGTIKLNIDSERVGISIHEISLDNKEVNAYVPLDKEALKRLKNFIDYAIKEI